LNFITKNIFICRATKLRRLNINNRNKKPA
jgi:hypothetical protein